MTQEPGYGELSMTINAESLSQLPFFAHLDAEALRRIVPHVREQALEPGQVAVWEGEPCAAVYFVARGLVRTRRMSLNGREHVLAYLGSGECFNLVPALDGGPNPVTVDAVSPTILYSVRCADCRQILGDHCELAHAVLEHLAREDFIRTFHKIDDQFKYVVISVPVNLLSDEVFEGNPFEKHLSYWSVVEYDKVFGPKYSKVLPTTEGDPCVIYFKEP